MNKHQLQLILIANQPTPLDEWLERQNPERLIWGRSSSLEAAGAGLSAEQADLILIDLPSVGPAALDLLHERSARFPEKALVLLSDAKSRALEREAMLEGASWTCDRERLEPDEIFFQLLHALREKAEAEASARRLMIMDPLTGLYNRRGFLALAQHQIKLSERAGRGFWAVRIEPDLEAADAKQGRQAVEQALLECAALLRSVFRDSDVIARLERGVFMALALDAAAADAPIIQERIRKAVENLNEKPRRAFPFRAHFGLLRCDIRQRRELNEILAMTATLPVGETAVPKEHDKP